MESSYGWFNLRGGARQLHFRMKFYLTGLQDRHGPNPVDRLLQAVIYGIPLILP
jgi:hypothetical protein